MLAEEFRELTKTNPTDAGPAPATAAAGETLRSRYRKAMYFQRTDRLPNFEFGYWDETLSGWREQGLPDWVTDEASAYRYFGIENWMWAPINVMGLVPGYQRMVISEDDEYITYRGVEGEVARINKIGHKSIPHFQSFPVRDRASWEEFRQHLQPSESRVPADWPQRVKRLAHREGPLFIGIGSMIGHVRNWLGFEGVAMMVHDDPELLEDMVETCCQLVVGTLQRVVRDIEFDCGFGWEDICFNSGPIVGVKFMREVVGPRYARITNLLRRHGCHLAATDCDGNITPVADVFFNNGINVMFPIEVHGGSDPVDLRRRHPDIRLQGGFDKMKLREGREPIRRELERLLPTVREGGFLPGVDHRVQADVTFADYRYYLKLKRDLFGVGGTPMYDESTIG
jgi:uroporphyrinogen decarboxylase